MESDVQNWITAGCAVAALLLSGGGALWKVCRLIKDSRLATAAQLIEIRQQNAVQSEQIGALSQAVAQLQQWAFSRLGDGR